MGNKYTRLQEPLIVDAIEPEQGEENCSICLVGMGVKQFDTEGPLPKNITRRRCGHAFHTACDREDNCPLCQQPRVKLIPIEDIVKRLREDEEKEHEKRNENIKTFITKIVNDKLYRQTAKYNNICHRNNNYSLSKFIPMPSEIVVFNIYLIDDVTHDVVTWLEKNDFKVLLVEPLKGKNSIFFKVK